MLNTSVVSFYDNFGLIFKALEDMATKRTGNWLLSSSPMYWVASSRENNSEYPNKPYSAKNYSLANIFVAESMGVCSFVFYAIVSESEAQKSSQIDDEYEDV